MAAHRRWLAADWIAGHAGTFAALADVTLLMSDPPFAKHYTSIGAGRSGFFLGEARQRWCFAHFSCGNPVDLVVFCKVQRQAMYSPQYFYHVISPYGRNDHL